MLHEIEVFTPWHSVTRLRVPADEGKYCPEIIEKVTHGENSHHSTVVQDAAYITFSVPEI